VYQCESCEEVFEQFHSIKIILEDCHLCGEQDSLKRLPSITRIVKLNTSTVAPVGTVIKNHIEEAKREIKQEQVEMSEDWTP